MMREDSSVQHACKANASVFNDLGQTLDLKWDHEIHDEVFNHGFLKGRPLSHTTCCWPQKIKTKQMFLLHSCSLFRCFMPGSHGYIISQPPNSKPVYIANSNSFTVPTVLAEYSSCRRVPLWRGSIFMGYYRLLKLKTSQKQDHAHGYERRSCPMETDVTINICPG
jgi:hypothetical protein